ncbi:DUF4139 domain-containing protein [Salirhabdus salicampi]|uniref:DUF4139 domain-containing protein n=1 Tax=Salirhabdus salicampi TaxID=476102 RepID=UPI0020C4BA3A|nr:DUF4139 domain-containing protein [Salirhabdus salicampi]MCP8615925.1 DUF4139 domain-containing protein [Salirhabdus salicampi]
MSVYKSSKQSTKDLAITVYNSYFAVVKEKRDFRDYRQQEEIHYMDVSEKIEIDSLIVKGLHIREVNYDHDLVDKHKLLKKYLDHTVYIRTDENEKVPCRLLSVSSGIILENEETKEILVDPEEEIILPKLPNGLIVHPSLICKVHPHDLTETEVTYTTGGFQWYANYVLYLEDEHLHLSGWVLITNESGTTFEDARLKLIAGKVNKETTVHSFGDEVISYNMDIDAEPDFVEQSFNDYHLYTLNGMTTLKNNQEKQINLLNGRDIKYTKHYEVKGRNDDVHILLQFENRKDNQLGLPLPKGKVKVYSEDEDDGSLEFIGEDRIQHTPKNETIKLYLGQAFDVICEGKHVDRKRNGHLEVSSYAYKIRNHKDQDVVLNIYHPISYKFIEVSETTHPFQKINAQEVLFEVAVPANSEEFVKFSYVKDHSLSIKLHK